MVDKSWGVSPAGAPSFRVRGNATLDQRAAERARARDERSAERSALRAAAASSGDPHAAAAARHRSSGRKDVVREQRDTRGYATVVDVERMRALAARGTSIAGLAGAFGLSEAEVEAALAEK